jgi:hypothetical protein
MTTLVSLNGETIGMYPGAPSHETLRQAEAIVSAPVSPQVKKTALRRLYESALAQDAKAALTTPTAAKVVDVAVGGATAATVGLALGWLAGSRAKGLDTPFGPIDGYAAAAGLVGSLIPGNPVSGVCRDAMVASTAILTYRKQEAKKRGETGIPASPAAHGIDDPTDHIVQIAKKLGLDL